MSCTIWDSSVANDASSSFCIHTDNKVFLLSVLHCNIFLKVARLFEQIIVTDGTGLLFLSTTTINQRNLMAKFESNHDMNNVQFLSTNDAAYCTYIFLDQSTNQYCIEILPCCLQLKTRNEPHDCTDVIETPTVH